MDVKRFFRRLCVSLVISAIAVTFVAGFAVQAQAEEPRYGGVLKIISNTCC